MRRPGYRAARMPRLLRDRAPVTFLLLLASCTLCGCQEQLPAYEPPSIPLQARIVVDHVIDMGDLFMPQPAPFSVYLENIDDGTIQYVLFPPYEMEAIVSVSLAQDPARKVLLEAEKPFETPSDTLAVGGVVWIDIPFPMQDGEGRPWNWQRPSQPRHELLFQGRLILRQGGSVISSINMPQVRVVFIYDTITDAP